MRASEFAVEGFGSKIVKAIKDLDPEEKAKAVARAQKQAEKERAELQKVMAKVEQDPEKIALQKQIQTYRGELNKRERDRLANIEKLNSMRAQFDQMDTATLQSIMKKHKSGDFYDFIKDIVDSRVAKQDLLKGVSGNIKQGTSTATKASGPWAQMGIDRDKFRKILRNPQDPRHAEARRLYSDYKGTE